MMIYTAIATCAVIALAPGKVSGFSIRHHGERTKVATTSQLMMSSSSQSRRDIFSNAASVAAVGFSALVLGPTDANAFQPGPITAQSAANKAAESYQGVYSDPNHPEGYRVIMASAKGATMELSDGVAKDAPEGTEAKVYKSIPISIKGNEFSFDFSFSEYHNSMILDTYQILIVF